MTLQIRKATKTQARLRMAIHGPSGSGKTMTSVLIAKELGSKILVIDTERSSSEKYADLGFDVAPLSPPYHPKFLIESLPTLGDYDVIIVDGLTPFWNGAGGLLELHDEEVKKQIATGRKVDTFAAWKNITPIYRRMVDAILACPSHVITTLRAKTEYERDDKGKIHKKGFAPEMRDQFDYELDIEASIIEDDGGHYMAIRKSRCSALSGKTFRNPGKDIGSILKSWLTEGAVSPPPAIAPPSAPATPRSVSTESDYDSIKARFTAGNLDGIGAVIRAASLTEDQLAEFRALYTKAQAA